MIVTAYSALVGRNTIIHALSFQCSENAHVNIVACDDENQLLLFEVNVFKLLLYLLLCIFNFCIFSYFASDRSCRGGQTLCRDTHN